MQLLVSVESAQDPFFNPNDFKQKVQVENDLKHEFIVNDIAIASVNMHLKSFSKVCEIKSENGAGLYSGCFGLGYDRLVYVQNNNRE